MIIATEDIGPERWHGTTGGTSNHNCKCLACRKVWTEYCKRRRAERSANIAPDDPRHGKLSFYYNHACRCAKCRAAHAKRARELRAAKKATQ